jgi:hypothetical protein
MLDHQLVLEARLIRRQYCWALPRLLLFLRPRTKNLERTASLSYSVEQLVGFGIVGGE